LYQSDDTIILASEIGEIKINSAAGVVINEGGADVDFRVESSGNANMLFVDGEYNRVGIGATPAVSLLPSKMQLTPAIRNLAHNWCRQVVLGNMRWNFDIDSKLGG
jgi:uncharacterized protein (DUF2345 family)